MWICDVCTVCTVVLLGIVCLKYILLNPEKHGPVGCPPILSEWAGTKVGSSVEVSEDS